MSRPALHLLRKHLLALVTGALAVSAAAGCGPSPELRGGSRGPRDCGGYQEYQEAQSAAPAPAPVAARSRISIWIQASLDDTDLRPDQRALTSSIVAELDSRMAPSLAVRRRIAAQIADEIAAGSLSEGRLEASLGELARLDEAAGAALDNAANRLFGALEGRQRSRFIHALRGNFRRGDVGDMRGHHGKAKTRALIEELNLTKDQKHAIRAKVREELKDSASSVREQRHALRDRLRAAARSFRDDQFDASGLGRSALALHRANLTMRLRVATAALPSLSSEQRERVAAHIRAHSEALD